MAREKTFKQVDGDPLKSFKYYSVSSEREYLAHDVPGFIPTQMFFIKKDSHDLDYRKRWMGISQL